jgi:hypothetical protein
MKYETKHQIFRPLFAAPQFACSFGRAHLITYAAIHKCNETFVEKNFKSSIRIKYMNA